MSFHVDFNDRMEEKTLSEVYTETLAGLLAEDKAVVTIDADLAHAHNTQKNIEEYPDRVLNVGIAEANMTGFAAGMAYGGKKPYIQTFGCFATRRAFDQIFISCAYGQNSVRIYGSDPGICSAFNGATHTPFEDLGLMRTLPGATILEITDSVMFRYLLGKVKDMSGVIYLRASRASVKKVYSDNSDFTIGKGNVLADGNDVTIVTGGILAAEALKAAKTLAGRGVSAAVIDMFTVKPIDKDLIAEYAKKTSAFVVTDNHNVNGGLGDAVAAVLCDRCPVPMKKLAVNDEYGEVGSVEYLQNRFSLNEQGIIEKVDEVLQLKKQGQ
ncbi:MAG: transketolase family protein [Treponema sp.]|jgi:transketolase|nr:transketolase family protein [Treponema sp.]